MARGLAGRCPGVLGLILLTEVYRRGPAIAATGPIGRLLRSSGGASRRQSSCATPIGCSPLGSKCWSRAVGGRDYGAGEHVPGASQDGGGRVSGGAVTWASRPTLSSEASRQMIDAAVGEAMAMGVRVTVVVVDESGVLKELARMDGAPLVSVQTALDKAYAAAAIGMPPDEFYAAIESDGAAVASFAGRPGLALIAGGLPVLADDQVAGAIGVAGAMTGAEDRRIAEAAARQAFR